jgi:hypothetical protein
VFIEKAAILRLQMALQLGLLAERLLNPCKDNCLPEDFVKKQYRSISLLAVLALLFGVVTSGTRLAAQRSASPAQQQQPAQQQPPPDQPSQAAPDSQA